MSGFRKYLATAFLSSLSLGLLFFPHAAPASHCGNYPLAPPTQELPPTLVISSGYWGVGGIGAFDGNGCVAGQEVADTRVLHPAADFVVLVLARANCQPGQTLTGHLSGLGLETDVPMGCSRDLYGEAGLPNHTAFVSDPYPVSGVGWVSGSTTLGHATQSQQIVDV